jgi:hypothetical protein
MSLILIGLTYFDTDPLSLLQAEETAALCPTLRLPWKQHSLEVF